MSKAKCALKPLGDRVVIRRTEAETKSPGGIVIPDSAKEKPQRGEVLAVGSGTLLDGGGCELKPGDRVLFGKYAGNEVEVDGEEVLIIAAEDVLGKF